MRFTPFSYPVLTSLFCATLLVLAGTSSAATIALLTGENEYNTAETLPAFARAELEPMGHRIVHIAAPPTEDAHQFENINSLREADLVVVSVRRRAPQKELLDLLRAHIAAGKPVVGIRTATHAFELRKGVPPAGHADWPKFDTEVLGGDYQDHWSNKPPAGPSTIVTIAKENAANAILAGVEPAEFKVTSHLYKSRDLARDAKVLLRGRVDGQSEVEPVAWTHMAGKSRVFYTSLGNPDDFQVPAFRTLLRNGILWALADKSQPKWADWVEPEFPFFSSVLDARSVDGAPKDNLTPRGLVLRLGHDCWTCFDVDLLRVAAVWRGKGVTPRALAPASYQIAGTKTLEGQVDLPKPDGALWLANGLYPGAQAGDAPSFTDPREPAPSPEEPGRGPLPTEQGRFRAVRMTNGGVRLEYDVAGTRVRESWSTREEGETAVIERRIRCEAVDKPLVLVLGKEPAGGAHLNVKLGPGSSDTAELVQSEGTWMVRLRPSRQPVDVRVNFALGAEGDLAGGAGDTRRANDSDAPVKARWQEEVTTAGRLSEKPYAYVVDDIPLPLNNPWHRNVRLADIGFFRDGTAAAVTLDGDVWLIRGLGGDLDAVRWKRFTSGLHEPLGLVVRDETVFVFDRNGIWKLRDTDGNGEADVHELFSNAFAQTAETREFPMGMRAAPDGSFLIAKGGQQGTTLGKHNGTILRVSPDGTRAEVVGRGLRQPFVAVHPRTGLVTASDQQGHYVPSTPLHIIDGGRYYGFLPAFLPKEQYPAPIADPLTWIPHAVNASSAAQVWLVGSKMGPLNDALIHIGYNRPELFTVRMNERGSRPQAAVMSLSRDLTFSPLAGEVNPADGQLYVTGFQVWGTNAARISGLARVRYTGAPSTQPREVVAMDKGMLLRFDVPLDPTSVTPENFTAERWNYRRTSQYGSPHLRLDGKPGQEPVPASSVYLSPDGRSVFVGLPDMKPVMQMTLSWRLSSAGKSFEQSASFTPYELIPFDSLREGFGALTVDLTPRAPVAAAGPSVAHAEPTIEEGHKLYETMGCIACHSTDGSLAGKVGPTWKGLFGRKRELLDGSVVTADEAYIRESILKPAAKVPKGFEKLDAGMPIYEGVLNDVQVRSLVLFIQSLGETTPTR
ncbi:ThuA domain-containing protein [Verrucomicrobiota bacterium sgz303538]